MAKGKNASGGSQPPADVIEASCSLSSFDLFRTLGDRERAEFELRCFQRMWPAGATVEARDTASATVYFVLTGRCQVLTRLPGTKQNIALDEIGPGGFFGEMAAIDGEPRSASILATERSQIIEMNGALFSKLLADHPTAALTVMRRMTEMIRQADTMIMQVSGLDAQTRVCLELLRRARTGGRRPANTGLIAPMPRHADIAARACATRETVARVLGKLMRRGLIRRQDDDLLVTDLKTLNRLGAPNAREPQLNYRSGRAITSIG